MNTYTATIRIIRSDGHYWTVRPQFSAETMVEAARQADAFQAALTLFNFGSFCEQISFPGDGTPLEHLASTLRIRPGFSDFINKTDVKDEEIPF